MSLNSILVIDDNNIDTTEMEVYIRNIFDLKMTYALSLQVVQALVPRTKYDFYFLGDPGRNWEEIAKYIRSVHTNARIVLNVQNAFDVVHYGSTEFKRKATACGIEEIVDKRKIFPYLKKLRDEINLVSENKQSTPQTNKPSSM